MRSMNEEDAVYAALLIQLLSDSDTSVLDDRVQSWIEHQYDFVFSENGIDDNHALYASDSRAPSPSPSSSVGAHRSFDFDHPDVSRYQPSLYKGPTTPHDTSWYSPSSPLYILSKEGEHGEGDRTHSPGFLKQEMTQPNTQSIAPSFRNILDKDLPAPPPSPAFSLKRAASSRTMRSRSSSGRMSRLPSLTSTLSSDQTQAQDIHPPPPVPVAHSLANIDSRKRSGSFPRKFLRVQDDKDSPHPSPTVSDFSFAYSRETHLTTPCASTPASPTSSTFVSTPCSPENVALPASPLHEAGFFREQALRAGKKRSGSSPTFPVLPKTHIPMSPSNTYLVSDAVSASRPPPLTNTKSEHEVIHRHRTEYSQSHWSVTTEGSLQSLPLEPRAASFSTLRTPTTGEKDEPPKTPKKQTRLLNLITRLSPSLCRNNASSTSTVKGKTDQRSSVVANTEHFNETPTQKKTVTKASSSKKKASLASIRTSFSLSRTSFSSHRPSISSTAKEGPLSSLPTSPIQTSHNASRPSLTDGCVTPLSKKSSLASLRASFSLSRTSFSSLVSRTEEVPPLPTSPGASKTSFSAPRPSLTDGTSPIPHRKSSLGSLSAPVTLSRASPLPTSPTRTSFSVTRPSFTDGSVTSEVVQPVPKVSLPKAPLRVTQINTTLAPLPHSVSKLNSPSQVSFSEAVTTSASASASRASLVSSNTSHSASGASSIPLPSNRMSLASAAGIERSFSTSSSPACETQIPAKPILRLTTKPSGPRMPALSSPHREGKAAPPRINVPSTTNLRSSVYSGSRIPQSPTKFTPPAKLASVLEARSERLAPAVASSISVSAHPTSMSKLPTPFRYIQKEELTFPTVTVEKKLPGRFRKLPIPTLDEDPNVETVRASPREESFNHH